MLICIVARIVEVEDLQCIDVLNVGCVEERLIEIEYDECQDILDVHCVAERLADVCRSVMLNIHILSLDVQC